MIVKMILDKHIEKALFFSVKFNRILPIEPRVLDVSNIHISTAKNVTEFDNLAVNSIEVAKDIFEHKPDNILFDKETLELKGLNFELNGIFIQNTDFEYWEQCKLNKGILRLSSNKFKKI